MIPGAAAQRRVIYHFELDQNSSASWSAFVVCGRLSSLRFRRSIMPLVPEMSNCGGMEEPGVVGVKSPPLGCRLWARVGLFPCAWRAAAVVSAADVAAAAGKMGESVMRGVEEARTSCRGWNKRLYCISGIDIGGCNSRVDAIWGGATVLPWVNSAPEGRRAASGYAAIDSMPNDRDAVMGVAGCEAEGKSRRAECGCSGEGEGGESGEEREAASYESEVSSSSEEVDKASEVDILTNNGDMTVASIFEGRGQALPRYFEGVGVLMRGITG